jgi:hypothetical protein
MTPNASRAPRAAPARTSASAKQFASFSIRTSRPIARSRSSRNGRPLRQTVFEFLSVPSRAESEPGVPTPTRRQSGATARSPVTRAAMRPTMCS